MKQFKIFAIFLSLSLLMAFALPNFAQDTDPDTEDGGEVLVEITGILAFEDADGDGDEDITVDGVIVAPASAFNPSDYEAGITVTVVGRLLNDDTIQAVSLVVVTSPESTPEPEVTPEVTTEPEMTPEPEITPEPEVTIEPEISPEPTVTACRTSHPVAEALSVEFGVDVNTILAWHCAGNGFGNIARALRLAELNGTDAQAYLDAHQGGQGWGQIMRDAGVHPSELSLGRVMGRGHNNDDDADSSRGNGSGGNGRANGNGNGNNGNGNGNSNGNGNGNGGGNNGNGNGNGGGNGRGNGN